MFGIQAKEFNFCFITPENFVSYGLRVLQVAFGKLWLSAAETVVLLEGSPLHQTMLELSE